MKNATCQCIAFVLAHIRQYSMQKMSKKKHGSVFSEQGIEKETAATKFVIMRLKPQHGGVYEHQNHNN